MRKVLFILKRREKPYSGDYGGECNVQPEGMSTGLLNSATFVANMLAANGIPTKLVVVNDNNDIDREVHCYRPTDVIIEALWVVPEKFDVLFPLHKNVNWVIRLHSAMPFIANEGIAMRWILDYLKYRNVSVSFNDDRIMYEFIHLFELKYGRMFPAVRRKILYQPNYFPQDFNAPHGIRGGEYINISCFGAIRPLKNQLAQAVAAILFARKINRKLVFHINGDRIEMKGSPVLHNIIDLFRHIQSQGHILVMNPWASHEQFVKLCSKMDIGMQVGFTETFNIIAADHLAGGTPIVVSPEVEWASRLFKASPTDTADMVDKLMKAYKWPRFNVFTNRWGLMQFCERSKKIWLDQYKSCK